MAGLNFSSLNQVSVADSATEPRRIFAALPNKDERYGYPRDVQTEVWDGWHIRRHERDLVIKMNTGGGKTVVGLVMLKSCLNEGVGPSVYIAPDIYLADQVRREAGFLGLETTDDPRSARFQMGKAILVTNVYKLVNGRSVFGVAGVASQPLRLGTVLVDDAHACLATVEEQFTLEIPRSHPVFDQLMAVLAEDLARQSRSLFRDVQEGDSSATMRVPYWAWADKQSQILDVLHPYRRDEEFQFEWPLIQEVLPFCRVAITAGGVEISPPCAPIDRIPSFTDAARRIYLTATLADDSVLVTHFAADPITLAKAITPKAAGDLGERMILTPLDTHPHTSDIAVVDFLAEQAKRHNVVVIVPSRRRAELWSKVAAATHDRNSIHAGVDALRAGHVGLVVLINKYDGIDLPGAACRILALDGLPEGYGALDRLDAMALEQSDAMVTRQVQRIEQGMGRGVRSNEDHCVVMLLGSRLTQQLYAPGAISQFSPATRAQLDLSRRVAEMLHGRPFSELGAVVDQCLNRDADWVAASRNALDGLVYDGGHVSDVAVARREAFDDAVLGRFRTAAEKLRDVVAAEPGVRLRGWLKQEQASYLHFDDPVHAQRLQVSAQQDNKALLKPLAGVGYTRLGEIGNQAIEAANYLAARYASDDDIVIGVNALLDDLVLSPDPGSVNRFEQAMHDLGLHIGFKASRPERDLGEGPDVLWSIGDARYLVVECKSAVITEFVSKHDVAQLSHSVDWFEAHYGASAGVPLLVHRTVTLHAEATARAGARIIDHSLLERLRDAVRQFSTSLSSGRAYARPDDVRAAIGALELNGQAFVAHWTRSPSRR